MRRRISACRVGGKHRLDHVSDRGVLRSIALPLREFDLIYQTRVLGNLRGAYRVGCDASSGHRRVTGCESLGCGRGWRLLRRWLQRSGCSWHGERHVAGAVRQPNSCRRPYLEIDRQTWTWNGVVTSTRLLTGPRERTAAGSCVETARGPERRARRCRSRLPDRGPDDHERARR